MMENSQFEVISFKERFYKMRSHETFLILFLIVILFLLEEWWGGSTYSPTLVRMGGNSKELVFAGDIWRLMTSIFLHAGYLHIFFNGYALIVLGTFINRIFGGFKFLILYTLSGLFGSLTSVLVGQSHLSVGASGALLGLFGASVALSLKPSSLLPETVRLHMKRITLINLAINFAISFLPMIDIWAHLGGGVSGFLIGIFYIKNGSSLWQRKLGKPITVFLLLCVALSFVVAFKSEKPWELKQRLTFRYKYIEELDTTIAIPSLLRYQAIGDDYMVRWAEFGRLSDDPMMVLLAKQTFDPLNNTSDEEELLHSSMRRRIFSFQPTQWIKKPVIVKGYGFLALESSFIMKNGVRIILYHQVKNSVLIQVEISVLPGTPQILLEDLSQIFSSVQNTSQMI